MGTNQDIEVKDCNLDITKNASGIDLPISSAKQTLTTANHDPETESDQEVGDVIKEFVDASSNEICDTMEDEMKSFATERYVASASNGELSQEENSKCEAVVNIQNDSYSGDECKQDDLKEEENRKISLKSSIKNDFTSNSSGEKESDCDSTSSERKKLTLLDKFKKEHDFLNYNVNEIIEAKGNAVGLKPEDSIKDIRFRR